MTDMQPLSPLDRIRQAEEALGLRLAAARREADAQIQAVRDSTTRELVEAEERAAEDARRWRQEATAAAQQEAEEIRHEAIQAADRIKTQGEKEIAGVAEIVLDWLLPRVRREIG